MVVVVRKYCGSSVIIDENQLSHDYNILYTKLLYSGYNLERYPYILNNNIKLYVKGDQVYTCNIQAWVMIFSGSYFIMCFALYIYNLLSMTCIMQGKTLGFVVSTVYYASIFLVIK